MNIGDVLELSKKEAKVNGTVPAGQVLVDGLGVGDVGNIVLRDRKNPVVIFCNFVEEIRLLERELKREFPQRRVENYRDSKNREKIERDFKQGKVDIIILQIHSGSTGLNLQKADLVMLYSTNSVSDDVSA